jgi:hypothetical protein
MQLDKWIELLKKGNCIPELDLKRLCIHVRLLKLQFEICNFSFLIGEKFINGRI